jgi:hypothetical protein
VRVLFAMQYPGYLRYYDSTVRELTARGHEVLLIFDAVHKQAEGLEALEGMEGVTNLGQLPRRGDVWEHFGANLRGTLDYVRYLLPEYTQAQYLRRRWERFVPPSMRWLKRLNALPPWQVGAAHRVLLAAERAIPSSRRFEGFLQALRPDVVIATPLLTTFGQTDLIKSAGALGIRTMMGTASWDHLTTKGVIRADPQQILVWNERQVQEAQRYHRVDPARITVTGAQPFDRWFARQPSRDREEFARRVGLPDGRPFVLFTGSTASISEPDAELVFVRRWIEQLRSAPDPRVRELAVLMRPHPYNSRHWSEADFGDVDAFAVWPRNGANPVNEDDRTDYFDSLHHADVVVGVNTSAMIEAAIARTPVLTVRDEHFSETQDGTLHFRYLLLENGGFARAAQTLEEHTAQLADVLADPSGMQGAIERFLGSFVRPHGLERDATPLVTDAIERLAARGKTKPFIPPVWSFVLRAFMWPMAAWLRARYEAGRVAQVMRKLTRSRRLARHDAEAHG